MSKIISHRLPLKLFTLSILISCLVVFSNDRTVEAVDSWPDCCITEYNTCNSQCGTICDNTGCHSDTNCEMTCNNQYADCSSPTGHCSSAPAQPQTPCQGCLDSCDQEQANCLADGISPTQCAYMRYRCRQRCNYGCYY